MQLAILIIVSLNLTLLIAIAVFALAILITVRDMKDESWEDAVSIDEVARAVFGLGRFVRDEYQKAAAANGMFREQAAEAKTKLSEHLAECHADEPKPEDTPAFTKLIDEEATHKVADLFKELGVSPDEVAEVIDLVEGEVTKIANNEGVTVYHNTGAEFNEQGEITSLLGIPVRDTDEDVHPFDAADSSQPNDAVFPEVRP